MADTQPANQDFSAKIRLALEVLKLKDQDFDLAKAAKKLILDCLNSGAGTV